ncbi:MAG: serine/threonine protein kinase [Pirellulaceae bacterium]
MSSDRTEQQDTEQRRAARDLSLKPKAAPASVPGYTIESLLGSGAYGEVWAALDQKTGRRVAVKFYTRQTSLDFSLLSREVEKLVFLSADRYVVQLLDVGWDAKPPYYVMDFIENGSLEDELKRRDTMPVDEAVELIEEICIGLMHLHGKGILHCDLKPGNVLLDQDKKPRLADFGQSRLSHEQAPALGTLFFMAPEQADLRAAPDARWDVYALGALLYCMLTGEPPFRDESMFKRIESSEAIEDRLVFYRKLIADAPAPTLHRKVPGVDRSLADIIDRCIHRDPKQRYPSVQSVFQALRQRDHAHARRPLMILGLVGPLLLLAVMSLFGWNAYRDAISQTDEAITRQTLTSNQWVAQLAARSAAEQMDNFFRVLSETAADEELRKLVARAVNEQAIREKIDPLADPADNDNQDLNHLRTRMIETPLLNRLKTGWLEPNLNDPTYPKADSWFICDYTGTQITSVFRDQGKETPEEGAEEKPVANTIGKNFSYRSYFTGRDQIARSENNGTLHYDVSEDPNLREHITVPTLSAIFQSRATQRWKIAFSIPLYLPDESGNDQFLGILAVTANMGSFIEFADTQDQYVMLVDGRLGEYRGTVLEHPLLSALIEDDPDIILSKELATRRLRTEVLEAFTVNQKDLVPFHDPISDDPAGMDYQRDWIASWVEVRRRSGPDNGSDDRINTGFKVIAVADRDQTLEPSRNLGQRLVRMGSLALAFFLLVSSGLLFIVFRSLRRSRERMARVSAIGEQTAAQAPAIHDMSTMMARESETPKTGKL